MSISCLPLEVWELILAHLPKSYLKIICSLSQDFHEISQPLIWNHTDFLITKSAVSRFKCILDKPIKHLHFTLSASKPLTKGTKGNALFKLIGTIQGLESITLKLLFSEEWDDECDEINRTFVTDSALSHLQSLTNLKVLHFEEQRDISVKGLCHLLDLPIEDLSLIDMPITNSWLGEINKLKHLRRLNVEYDPVYDYDLADPGLLGDYGLILKSHPDMEYFRCLETLVNDEAFEQICASRNLKELVLLDFKRKEKIPLLTSALTWMTKLETLKIHHADFTEGKLLHEILACKNLRHLSLKSCTVPRSLQIYLCTLSKLDLTSLRSADVLLESLSVTPSLLSLNVSFSNVTDAGFKQLKNFPNLRVLKMTSVDGVTAGALNILVTLKHLRHLEMNCNKHLQAEHMQKLELPPGIETLAVEDIPLGGNVLKHFSQFEHLRDLNVSGCTGIDLRDLSYLCKVPLRSLQIHNINATEKCLDRIYQMKTLEKLGILTGNNRLVYGKGKWLNNKMMKTELVRTIRRYLPYVIVE